MLGHTCARSTESKFRILYLGNDLELIAALRQSLIEPEYRLVSSSIKISLKSKVLLNPANPTLVVDKQKLGDILCAPQLLE